MSENLHLTNWPKFCKSLTVDTYISLNTQYTAIRIWLTNLRKKVTSSPNLYSQIIYTIVDNTQYVSIDSAEQI